MNPCFVYLAIIATTSAAPISSSSNNATEAQQIQPSQDYSLIAVPHEEIQDIVTMLHNKGYKIDYEYKSSNNSADGVQDKSFASVMQNIVSPILSTGASLLSFLKFV